MGTKRKVAISLSVKIRPSTMIFNRIKRVTIMHESMGSSKHITAYIISMVCTKQNIWEPLGFIH